ncbi:hypothetical protein ASPCAL09950 [Aspergillus calidoustus]|uniref:Tubby C-terminal-like domain-containing protein n=1 Tax=Aspergillus calidoustus TaxID=454130 RepID=A0A0U5CBI4_ASPCI|nr:hypothetical protein ASPCAL09950 [Aspergillus calidoustus]
MLTSSSNSLPFGANENKSSDVGLQTPSSRESDSADDQSLSLESSRLYHIYHTPIRYDYRVSNADKKPLYFVYNSHLTPDKADITVHTGDDKNAPIAGVCKFIHLSRHCKVGLGDPQRAGSMVWEDLQCQNFRMTKYRFEMSIPSAHGGYERRSFLWKRTQSVGADGDSPSFFSLRNFKLVDELNGQNVAVFTSNSFKSPRKNGKLQVAADYGPDFDMMALITLLAMYERIRRRTGGKGGGGGGGDGG